MNRFVSGSVALAATTADLTVGDLSLPFTPSRVSVAVRLPNASCDLISAHLVGVPSASGSTVALSAPIPAEPSGYMLDWTAFSEGNGALVPAGDTLQVTYGELKTEVATFLGYDPTHLTEGQAAQIDGYIQSGVRNFYYPPKTAEGVDENFEWSFIRQAGTISVAAGVATYLLPDGFGRIAGQIEVADDMGPMLPIVPYGEIVKMSARGGTGRPRFAAVVASQRFGERGQMKELKVYPTPDKAYTLNFVCDSDTGKLDATNRPFPLGGAMYSELVTESCLAVAEQRANDEEGLHTKKFTELLVSMIARDRKSSAQSFGDIGDPEARECEGFFPLRTRGCLY